MMVREAKEPEIKLFGRKIMLPENESNYGENGGEDDSDSHGGGGDGEKVDEEKRLQSEEDHKFCETKTLEDDQVPSAGEELKNPNETSESDGNPKTPSRDEDGGISENHPKTKNEAAASEATNGQQKPLKKPDKILPCPRCNSMDTKFCYYNNYNINQPRHFCKSCQRYWTAGGMMRNVPVGAGRRKNKNSASHCRHITISEALQAARIDAPNGFHHPGFKPNGTVLSFGPDSPLCESMASALNLQDKRNVPNGITNGYNKINLGSPVSCKNGENADDLLIRPPVHMMHSIPDGSKTGTQPPAMQSINGFPAPVPCIPGAPWPFPWNSALPLPAIYPPGYPIPFCPSPYWNCGMANTWNVPWLPIPSPTSNQTSPKSPLGKHSRHGELLSPNSSESKEPSEPKTSETLIVIPKTLRIDDPEEAAKSSIWETLGIKYDSIRREGLFKALQPKGDKKNVTISTSPVLQANPAALSRSITFQEGA